MDTIVVPTDFSPHSEGALRFASSVASRIGGTLLIVHVAPAGPVPAAPPAGMPSPLATYPAGIDVDMEETSMEQERLTDQLNRVTPTVAGVKHEHLLLQGSPDAEIVKLSEDIGAFQIVMGSYGRTGLQRMLMGSTAESVVRQARCPVTIVKSREAPEEVPEPKLAYATT
jgi:nucleotide-binding universal stress UspA family protein